MNVFKVVCILGVVAFLFACSEQPTDPVAPPGPTFMEVDLPFSIQDLLDSMDILEGDPLFTPPEIDGDPVVLPVGTYDRYAVEIIWGVLGEPPTSELSSMDWTGGVMLTSPGVVIPRQVIDFERGEDSLMRVSVGYGLGWASKTTADFDGVLLDVYIRTDIMTLVIPELILKMVPFEQRWNTMELADLDKVYDVDNIHKVAIKSRKVEDSDCPRGRMAGKWLFKSRQSGYFLGHWLTEFGSVRGYLFGKFWADNDGGRYFEGYWVVRDRRIEGHLKGKWEFDPNTSADLANVRRPRGHFEGRFTNEEGNLIGSLRGKFGYPFCSTVSISDQNLWPTAFVGEWWVDCPDVVGL